MAIGEKRALKVFLCHTSGDKPQVRTLYKHLVVEGVDAWLDKEKLLPGQDWRVEIPRAVRESDVVVVCLSNKSITQEGYIQKEIKFALDFAEEKPDGTIFIIPARLEDCPVPEKLSRWHWVDLFEENGYVKLLSSLKLRADIVGAVITPSYYGDGDTEKERRLDQYYTEGLAAFYTEDWSKACQRFQLILAERPGDKNAIEKFEEAERQRDLSKLYVQAVDACRTEDWQTAIKALDELLKKSSNYKDSAELFKTARKQKQLKELYAEAKKLHAAKKWDAVLKVFEQIFLLEQNHPDPDGLLLSAQKEAAELKRLSDLNDLYSQSVREMDLGKWYEARNLLEQVHKAQTGFLETESLLRKAENEILKIEKINERNNQINTLYEQAHGLIRSKNWRKALDKIEEIQKLDDSQFEDKDGIAEKAKSELEREEREVQKQNQLAAIYADAVRLLKVGKYQEALDRWNEVKVIDPKYPDRQQVQKVANRKLAEAGKNKLVFYKNRLLLAGVVITLLVTAIYLFMSLGGGTPPASTVMTESKATPSPMSLTSATINQPILFSEDFEDGIAQEVTYAAYGWRILTDETGNKVYDIDNSKGSDFPGVDLGSQSWKDYKIEFRTRFLGDSNALTVIYFRHDATDYRSYVVSLNLTDIFLGYDPKGGDWNLITDPKYDLKKNIWYWVQIEVKGTEIKVFIDNNPVININDSHYSAGGVTIQAGPRTHAQFDDIQVISLEK
jgi:outer membrane protein assembly factor BamD (BamD/ComL family)